MFYGLMYPGPFQYTDQEPNCFRDLNLDQIFRPITVRQPELAPFFFTPLRDPEAVYYRQQILKDLSFSETQLLFENFSHDILFLSQCISQEQADICSGDPWKNHYYTRGRLLYYTDRYCKTITEFSHNLRSAEIHSDGLQGFARYLDHLISSEKFIQLTDSILQLQQAFSREKFCMQIRGSTVRVKKYDGESSLAPLLSDLFRLFPHPDEHRLLEPKPHLTSHVEAQLLACLARLYPEDFHLLDLFSEAYSHAGTPNLLQFCQELRFYLSWLNRIALLKDQGLCFCIPELRSQTEDCQALGFFDLAMASDLGNQIVTNDFTRTGQERLFVITGPNQGGKTTFARAFGQIHYLASLGLSVPGGSAALCIPDQILTHFQKAESPETFSGKLQDDLMRLRTILEQATDKSLVIINEIYASTTLSDALDLGGRMMDRLAQLGVTGAVVTFMDELADHGPETVSLMSTVRIDDPTVRTFRIVRSPPNGLAYAAVLAGRHGLTYDQIIRRIP